VAVYVATRGLIIADTKFESGLVDGELILIDEALTPDSLRYWPQEGYVPGRGESRVGHPPVSSEDVEKGTKKSVEGKRR
jgi:phosphoribosylaminoimidazole-succinocarboxamide synthase